MIFKTMLLLFNKFLLRLQLRLEMLLEGKWDADLLVGIGNNGPLRHMLQQS